tara:strand:- start:257 stop:1039 length:783 start_codon:yes stop_codon:yes gene_type:complete
MPNWKKLITSGSSGSLAYLSVGTSIDAQSFTGSLLSNNGVVSGSSQTVANLLNQDVNFGSGDITVDGNADFNGNIYGLGNFFVNASTFLYNSGTSTITFATNGSMNIGLNGNTNQTTEVNGASLTVNAANTTLQDAQIDSLGIGTAASGTTGEIRATGDITAFYSSDERLKENIKPIENATDKVKALGGYTFNWKEGIEEVTSKSGKDVGIIAQELEKVLPELVNTRDNGYKGVDYPKLVALLIESNKELIKRIEELEKK